MRCSCVIKADFHKHKRKCVISMKKTLTVGLGSGLDIKSLMPVGLGSGSVTPLSDSGRARTENSGPIRTQ